MIKDMSPWERHEQNGSVGIGWAFLFGDLVYLKPHMGGFTATI